MNLVVLAESGKTSAMSETSQIGIERRTIPNAAQEV
jgi:hypothetical protein